MTTGSPSALDLGRQFRARILVRLHADQTHHAAAGGADAFGHGRHIDDGVALVAGFDLDIDVGAERAVVGAPPHQPIDAGETVRRQRRTQPLDDVAVPVVMRRLDQLDPEGALGQITVQIIPPNGTFAPTTPAPGTGDSAGSAAALQEIPARRRYPSPPPLEARSSREAWWEGVNARMARYES